MKTVAMSSVEAAWSCVDSISLQRSEGGYALNPPHDAVGGPCDVFVGRVTLVVGRVTVFVRRVTLSAARVTPTAPPRDAYKPAA